MRFKSAHLRIPTERDISYNSARKNNSKALSVATSRKNHKFNFKTGAKRKQFKGGSS